MRGIPRPPARACGDVVWRLVAPALCAAFCAAGLNILSLDAAQGADDTPAPRSLEVAIESASHVFAPDDSLRATITPLPEQVSQGAQLVLRVTNIDSDSTLWESTEPLSEATSGAPIEVAVPTPAREGAYCLHVALQPPRSLTARLRPFQETTPVAAAVAEFVVVDPTARLPRLTETWTRETTIDPANPHWWQRLPAWTQASVLVDSGRLVASCEEPVLRTDSGCDMIEVAPPSGGDSSAWLAIKLPIRRPGMPYALDLELPTQLQQELAFVIREADSANPDERNLAETGVVIGPSAEVGVVTHRVEFWPRTGEVQLLVASYEARAPLTVGRIRVLRREIDESPADAPPSESERLALAYYADPAALGQSATADNWALGLRDVQRIAQSARAAGYNGAMIRLPDDADAARRLLDAALQVFDREGLALAPVIGLTGDLPALESDLSAAAPRRTGWQCVDVHGETSAVSALSDNASNPPPRYNLLNRAVQQASRARVAEIAELCRGHACFAGMAVQVAAAGYGVLPGVEWCVDDDTATRFAASAGFRFQTADPEHFAERASEILGPRRAQWITWRNQEVARFYASLAGNLPAGRNGVRLILCLDDALTGDAAHWKLRQSLAGKCSPLDATDEAGLDLRALAEIEGTVVLRPRRLSGGSRRASAPLDDLLTESVAIDDALAGLGSVGESLFSPARPLSQEFAPPRDNDGFASVVESVAAPLAPPGDAARRPLARALVRRDCALVAVGGPMGPACDTSPLRSVLQTLCELPAPGTLVRLTRAEPVALRTYKSPSATTVCLVNTIAWPVRVTAQLAAGEPTPWRRLGSAAASPSPASEDDASGVLPPGETQWNYELPPYGVVAWQWQSPQLRLGAISVQPDGTADAALRDDLAAIETRMKQLNQRRVFGVLPNAGFEEAANGGDLAGWKTRVSSRGQATVDRLRPCSGQASMHLVSADVAGVTVESAAFEAPATGRIAVSVQLQALNFHPSTTLELIVEFQRNGQWIRRSRPAALAAIAGQWATCELDVDELPLDATLLRVAFHLSGPGEAWIDDVQLFDVWFTNAERIDLTKRFFAAKLALEEGKLADCQQMLAGYWPQYLLQNIPAAGALESEPLHELCIAETPGASDPESATETMPEKPQERRRLTERVKDLAPRLWR